MDPACEAFGDCRLADAGLADIERIVLRTPAQDLHCPVDFDRTADQRINLTCLSFLVKIDAELFESTFVLLFAALLLLGLFLVLGAADLGRVIGAIAFADAVRDKADCIEPAHILLLQEVDRIALALGKQGD